MRWNTKWIYGYLQDSHLDNLEPLVFNLDRAKLKVFDCNKNK